MPKVTITKKRIALDAVLRSVADQGAGGTVSFIGTVRNSSQGRRVAALELESAEDLARTDLMRIARNAGRKYEISKLSVTHRVGKLSVGDVIVAIAVSAPHREDAFGACRFVIDELKKTTPIWKKEFRGGKGQWVEGGR